MIKRIFAFIGLLLITEIVYGQETENCKFLSALTYVMSNKVINGQLTAIFLNKKSRKRKMEFTVSDRVAFIGISGLEKELQEKKYFPTAECDQSAFRQKYSFKTYTSPFLSTLNIKG
jgi:hypothetical protein